MRFVVALCAAMLAAAGVTAQESHFGDTISVGYVMVPFTALGVHNDPITNLRERDVQLYVDGVRVRSDMFERSVDAPVSYTILLDGSGSMGLAGKMDAARSAVDALFARRREGDDFALYVFDDKEAHEVVPFTSDVTAVTRALANVKPFGKTAFFDALATMPERSRLGRNASRAIILLSDGIDNNSHLTRQQLAAQLEGVAIPIYPLGLREPAELKPLDPKRPNEELSDLGLLDEIANLTGGHLFIGNDSPALISAVDALNDNLRAQYLLGFAPTGRGGVKYRRISLKLAGRARSARVRAGYRGTEPPALAAGKS